MKKILTGFCMCWGMFCYIPGPKKWDEEARPYMLAWLPTVGAIMGIIWALCLRLFLRYDIPDMAGSALLVWMPFILSGFMHVDGYMDVNDAVMSRGSLEKKRAILKDSRCGTFAIVSLIFLILIEFGCMASVYGGLHLWYRDSFEVYLYSLFRLIVIMMVPRAVSGFVMMTAKPMDTSQYFEMKKNTGAAVFLVAQAVILFAVMLLLISNVGVSAMCFTSVMCILGSLISMAIARRDLQGMNGDIAGYGILWGELMGIVSMMLHG